jgi:hypothetical protein
MSSARNKRRNSFSASLRLPRTVTVAVRRLPVAELALSS